MSLRPTSAANFQWSIYSGFDGLFQTVNGAQSPVQEELYTTRIAHRVSLHAFKFHDFNCAWRSTQVVKFEVAQRNSVCNPGVILALDDFEFMYVCIFWKILFI